MKSIRNYYLDINKLQESSISDKEKDKIYDYYNQLMCHLRDKEDGSAESICNTLLNAGYLVDKEIEDRDKKVKELINE